MYKLLLPINKRAKIKGYWLNNNKLFKDNLKIITLKTINKKILNNYAINYNQIALFYYNDKGAFIYYKDNQKIEILKNRALIYHRSFKGLKDKIKGLLLKYKGLTVYKNKKGYILISYY